MQVGKSGTIYTMMYTCKNLNFFLELRIGLNEISKAFLWSRDLLSTWNEYIEVYSRKYQKNDWIMTTKALMEFNCI